MTITLTNTIDIARPPADVWAVVSDYATDTRWRKGIVEMRPDVDGPPEVGTRVREVLELGGRIYTTETAVTDSAPDSRTASPEQAPAAASVDGGPSRPAR